MCLRMSFQLTRESEHLETYLAYMIRGSRAPPRLHMNKFHVLPFPTTHIIATRNDQQLCIDDNENNAASRNVAQPRQIPANNNVCRTLEGFVASWTPLVGGGLVPPLHVFF